MKYYCVLLMLFLAAVSSAQEINVGTIKGSVIDVETGKPVEFVNVVVRKTADTAIVTGQATDAAGKFEMANIPDGEYTVRFSLLGYKEKSSKKFLIDAQHKHLNLGEVQLIPAIVDLDEVIVSAEKSMYNMSIDRKVYNVDQDMMSKAGSASDLLQNVPSVQVDIDGNVTLRGSSNVLFMLNGKTSPLLRNNSAVVLQQMPANTIEKIEVITNPSAKFSPDGTAGILNIVLKKNTAAGLNGDLAGNTGNQDRYNGTLRLNYNPGPWNLYGSFGMRRDIRNRINTDNRRQIDSTASLSYYNQSQTSYASPTASIASAGCDYHVTGSDQAGLSGNYFDNLFTRTENADNMLLDSALNPVNQYNRSRIDYEYEKEYGFTTYFQHDFPKEDHTLRLEYTASWSPEEEDNHYTNLYQLPVTGTSFDNALIQNRENRGQLTLDYSDPIVEHGQLEAGYSGDFFSMENNFVITNFDFGRQQFITDLTKTNLFGHEESIQAAYVTYKQSFGAFGLMAGLRAEHAAVKSHLVTLDSVITNDYSAWYPSMHFSYKLNPGAELQLSYSRRTRRPESDDLNPFPEWRDPRNIASGNPRLLPEYIHSLELGCQFETELFTITPALYYKYTYNRFTVVTIPVNDTLILTTHQNLSNDRAGGLEVVVSANIGEAVTAHWTANAYVNTIDATNLGYAGDRSINTWSSALTLNVNLTGATRWQINSNYNASRLTPQGEYSPGYIVNTGFRHDMEDGKLSIILTMSDIFKSMKRELALDTPSLYETTVNKRDLRSIFLGFTWHFGVMPKKMKQEEIRYDE